MPNKLKLKFKSENFQDFLNKLKDLTTIGDDIKIKIDKEHILIYSTLGKSVMLAFKNYLLKTDQYFDLKSDIESSIDIIISNSTKLVKNLEFLKDNKNITLNISYQDSDEEECLVARSIQITAGKLKVNWLAGEKYQIREITKQILEQRLDLKNRNWSFILDNQQFNNIKKLSNINSENIITITVEDGKVLCSEKAAWELEVGEIEKKSASFIFNKRFFKCIDDKKETVEFNLFDSFILIKDNDSNLMLSYEQDFSEEDV